MRDIPSRFLDQEGVQEIVVGRRLLKTDGKLQDTAALPLFDSIPAQSHLRNHKQGLVSIAVVRTHSIRLGDSAQAERIGVLEFWCQHHEKQKCEAIA